MTRTTLFCPACQNVYDPAEGHFACPKAGDGREHILNARIDASEELAEELLESWRENAHPGETPGDPLKAFACLGGTQPLASRAGYREAARRLQEGLDRLEGAALTVTPLVPVPSLAKVLGMTGGLAVKDETGQPGGSHKVRHLAGTMLYLEALRAGGPKRPLAISSCGNAALAAACVARAAGYSLSAFVPEDVHPGVARLLRERGVILEIVPRLSTGSGDPCYLAFRDAVRRGAAPFCCSGRDNWSNIEGGQSLGYEAALQWQVLGHAPGQALGGGQPDHLVLQIGGGALARSVAGAFRNLERLGIVRKPPRIHACQTEGAFPFARAWLLLLAEIARNAGFEFPSPAEYSSLAGVRQVLDEGRRLVAPVVDYARAAFGDAPVRAALRRAVEQPASFMWAWDGPTPHSQAHGILDDETYDWYFLARALLRTGGQAVVAPEELVVRAHALALAHTNMNVSATGSAGLAGLLALRQAGVVAGGDRVGLFFTGINR